MTGQHSWILWVWLVLQGSVVQAVEPPLLGREVFFEPAARTMPRIAPNGTLLSYLAPTPDGAVNVWLVKMDSLSTPGKPLTHAIRRGVNGYRWAEDNTHILYWQDNDGDEHWHLYVADIRTGQTKDLTPFPNVRIQNLMTDARHPHEVLVGLNRRLATAFDVYRINLDDGTEVLDTLNPGDVLSWTADHDFVIRAATAFNPESGETIVRVRDRSNSPWRDLMSWPFEDGVFSGQVNGGSVVPGYTRNGQSLYAISTTGSDKSHLVKIAVASGRWQPVAGSDCDVADDTGYPGVVDYDQRSLLLQSPLTGELDAIAFECEQRSWHAVNPAVRADLEFLQTRLSGFPYITGRNHADTLWVVATWASDRPIEYSLYDRRAKKLTLLFSEEPQMPIHWLRKREPFKILARDGREIPVYLTRPEVGTPVPLVLCLHGGPWDRDHDDYDPFIQLLVNRGYAVLQVEYRGSIGYGKALLNAGNHEFGLKMRDDVIDAAEWAVARKIADPARIGVLGESGGGYLALRSSEARPDLFRATVDVVGPTDIGFLLESMPESWQPVKARWIRRIGDAEHDQALNRKLSPQFAGQSTRTSFLIAQGANDPRVNPRHSETIVARLRQQGARVDYLVYPDEGHGLARRESKLDFYGRVEEFLARTLGGRLQRASAQPGVRVEVK